MANTNKITVETFKYYLDNYFPFYVQKNTDNSFSLALKQKDIGNKSFGENSVAIGSHVVANGANQFVIGQYNEEDENALFLIGGGSFETGRKNIFKVSPSVFEAKVGNNISLSNGSASLALDQNNISLSTGNVSLGLNQNNISLSNGDASLDLNKDSTGKSFIVINGDINSSYLTDTYYNKTHIDDTYATIVNFNQLRQDYDNFVGENWSVESDLGTLKKIQDQINTNTTNIDVNNNYTKIITTALILTQTNIGDYLIKENLKEDNQNNILTKQNFYTLIPVYQGDWR